MIWHVGSVDNYTAQDFAILFEDANLTTAQEIGATLIGNLSAKTASPGTNFYGFYSSGVMLSCKKNLSLCFCSHARA